MLFTDATRYYLFLQDVLHYRFNCNKSMRDFNYTGKDTYLGIYEFHTGIIINYI